MALMACLSWSDMAVLADTIVFQRMGQLTGRCWGAASEDIKMINYREIDRISALFAYVIFRLYQYITLSDNFGKWYINAFHKNI